MPSAPMSAETRAPSSFRPSPQRWAFSILHSFTAGKDGGEPSGTLVPDSAGNLYGTAGAGGLNRSGCGIPSEPGCGVIFQIDRSGKESVFHYFTGGNAGQGPGGGLLRDEAGDFYGLASNGSTAIIFKLSASDHETTLFAFSNATANGKFPFGPLVSDGAGNLYGTTYGGGSSTGCGIGCGVVYQFNINKRKETILYNFTGKADGANPAAGLIRDAAGNLYGTTFAGGSFDQGYPGNGVVFKVKGTQETVLHAFTSYQSDGAYPTAPVTFDGHGNLFGTTELAGASGWGVVFRLTPTEKETVLYNFSAQSDGGEPRAGLVRDSSGNLYGTTNQGGRFQCQLGTCGVVFELDRKGKETVLHAFDGNDGGQTSDGLFRDASGDLYGTTPFFGPFGQGVVFKLSRAKQNEHLNHT